MKDFFEALSFIGMCVFFVLLVITFIVWLPERQTDRYEEQNMVCFVDKKTGFEKVTKKCYKLTPLK